jgi:hypothetical protein
MSTNPARSTLTIRIIDLVIVSLRYVVPWIAAGVVFYICYEAILAVNQDPNAGATWIKMIGGASRTRGFAMLLGILGCLYGLNQQKLRRQAVARMSKRIQELENLVAKSTASAAHSTDRTQ